MLNAMCMLGLFAKQLDCTIVITYTVAKKYKFVSDRFGHAPDIYVLPDEHDHTQHGSARID